MFQQFIYANYVTCMIILFMLVFLCTNTTFERRITKLFMWPILFTIVLIVVDTVESWTATLSYPTMLRVWMSAFGYTIRPLCILCVLEIIVRDKRRRRLWLELPAVINGVISFSALFSDVAFSYSAENEFVRGPLGASAYVVSTVYLLILMTFSILYFKRKCYHESMIVLAIVIAAVLALVFEVAFKFEGMVNATIALSITFYYLFFHTQISKRDHLTLALNRRCFYMDAEKNRDHITAVISIDLNYLKFINDTCGHEAGDEAICAVARCVEKHLPKECRLYRVGGDEFTVLCMRRDPDTDRMQLEAVVADIKAEMATTEYSCAIGLAMVNGRTNFKEVCAEADRAMYHDKLLMKRGKQS